ncbi:class I adenylate-forming enzyme family protein [Candidatus Entotheonella palauensis]|uniref:class I adenylate-forming enzyme family protein n=1 Tax=Candidatus Entotheonella palauensis TaxID=93172 RepID=UPI000B7CB6C7|nr:fatty acid--CoA ligase family protein [Candidatus Entotheonella palauensis]
MPSHDWLLHRLRGFEHEEAIIWQDERIPYGHLIREIQRWQQVVSDCGIRPGECVAIHGDYTPDVCALLLALYRRACMVVPLSSTPEVHHADFERRANVSARFAFDETGAWSLSRPEAGSLHPLVRQLQQLGAPGLVLFSSGSTGEHKASLLNFDKLTQRFQRATRHGYRTLFFLLLDHIGGINTLLHTLSHGGTLITAPNRRPETICQTIERHRVQLLPTTPTFLNMLLISEAYAAYDLSSLQLVTYGTEPMPASTLRHLAKVFPQVRLKQTYGLSEVGILSPRSQDSGSLWVQVGGEGYETKIVDQTLWIRAETAMLGYLNAPSPFDADGWLNTGDVVEQDGEYLRILGRRSEIINVGGEKVYPAEVESVLLEMENVTDVMVQGRANPVTGQVVMAHVRPEREEDPDALRRRIRRFCKGRLAAYKIPVAIKIHHEPLHNSRFKKSRANPEVSFL